DGNMVVDIGGGTTDIAVISLGDVVVRDSVKVAGDKFDDAIIRYMRHQHNILIGERTAEAIKVRIGAVYSHPEPQYMDVKGRCLIQGLPRVVKISSYEIMNALTPPISEVIDAICDVIERTPPELIGDILRNGIVMTGGGSLLYGFDRLIEHVTNIPTRVAPKAVSCVAMGTGIALESYDLFPENSVYVTTVRSPRPDR
ncbi:MAG: rod shape-determining protein, partial [Clostridia bacterium]|nr:rod shape-determining protein [Clostridia bacterium]